jgi:hypothetical protein
MAQMLLRPWWPERNCTIRPGCSQCSSLSTMSLRVSNLGCKLSRRQVECPFKRHTLMEPTSACSSPEFCLGPPAMQNLYGLRFGGYLASENRRCFVPDAAKLLFCFFARQSPCMSEFLPALSEALVPCRSSNQNKMKNPNATEVKCMPGYNREPLWCRRPAPRSAVESAGCLQSSVKVMPHSCEMLATKSGLYQATAWRRGWSALVPAYLVSCLGRHDSR